MTTRTAERAYTVKEAADLKSVSPDFILKHIRATGADPKVPPLAAKKVGKGYRVSASALEDWYERLGDA